MRRSVKKVDFRKRNFVIVAGNIIFSTFSGKRNPKEYFLSCIYFVRLLHLNASLSVALLKVSIFFSKRLTGFFYMEVTEIFFKKIGNDTNVKWHLFYRISYIRFRQNFQKKSKNMVQNGKIKHFEN